MNRFSGTSHPRGPDRAHRTIRVLDPEELPCTCQSTCRSGCKGECGCEACALVRLVDEDESAVWDEHGNLINVDTQQVIWYNPGHASHAR